MNDRTVPAHPRFGNFRRNIAGLFAVSSLPLFVAGCITYTPQELSAMPPLKLCEMQLYSRVNLKDETKRLLQTELSRRNEDCRKYVPEIEAERAYERETAMYCCTSP